MPIPTAPPVLKPFLEEDVALADTPLVDFAVGFSVGTRGKSDELGLKVVVGLLGVAGDETVGGEEVEGTEGGGDDNVGVEGEVVGGREELELDGVGGGVSAGDLEELSVGGIAGGEGGDFEDGGVGTLAGGGGELKIICGGGEGGDFREGGVGTLAGGGGELKILCGGGEGEGGDFGEGVVGTLAGGGGEPKIICGGGEVATGGAGSACGGGEPTDCTRGGDKTGEGGESSAGGGDVGSDGGGDEAGGDGGGAVGTSGGGDGEVLEELGAEEEVGGAGGGEISLEVGEIAEGKLHLYKVSTARDAKIQAIQRLSKILSQKHKENTKELTTATSRNPIENYPESQARVNKPVNQLPSWYQQDCTLQQPPKIQTSQQNEKTPNSQKPRKSKTQITKLKFRDHNNEFPLASNIQNENATVEDNQKCSITRWTNPWK
ncbi:hypothetical protein V6N13_052431 [Hibiscus sabdariffa]|uniref:Uncharacterized protein n=1 Tax=Hibiscus sabdariffa TaxID=183260 RepID=A0ABR2Q4C0_9ROSI